MKKRPRVKHLLFDIVYSMANRALNIGKYSIVFVTIIVEKISGKGIVYSLYLSYPKTKA